MTPLDLARNLARDPDPETQALAVAMVYRGLTDDDPTGRMGWPEGDATVSRAATFLDVKPTADLFAAVRRIAPTVSDAMLNRGADR